MGLFSKSKNHSQPKPAAAPKPAPTPAPVTESKLAEARSFMAEWVDIVGQASDPVFWGALEKFGRIGEAIQAENTHSANMRFMTVANNTFGGDFKAMFDWPWRNWIAIASKARENGDNELSVHLFFFAWAMKNQVTFDMNVTGTIGFEKPRDSIFAAIAKEAHTAATALPEGFTIVERAISEPVTRETILLGTAQVAGIA
jgi:hypothetical protein